MTAVQTHNDFDPLEEIIIGSAAGYALPATDISLRHFFDLPAQHPGELASPGDLARAAEETDEDLAEFARVLAQAGVTVRRPDPFPQGLPLAAPGWSASSNHGLMPRDCLLVIGSAVIEAPMPVRARYAETFPYRNLLRGYFQAGADWVAAPRPQLTDQTYVFGDPPALAEHEPLFDAANVLRCGADVFFNISNTGNRLGAAWLARVLGPRYTVHEMAISADHVGTTLHILRPGLLLANAARLGPDQLPGPLRGWRVLWFDDPHDDGYALSWPRASTWIGMNIVSVDHGTVIVPAAQDSLIRLLEKAGLTAVPVPYRHGRTFGGGFHCCSLDIRRAGRLESYLSG
jgi:N-dimethylarginine dimethylaminohydrolase